MVKDSHNIIPFDTVQLYSNSKAMRMIRGRDKEHPSVEGLEEMPTPHVTLPFSTVVARWNVYERYPNLKEEVKQLYKTTIRGFSRF